MGVAGVIGHISVLRSVFSDLQQQNFPRGQDSIFARDILAFYGRKADTMLCLTVPLSLFCDGGPVEPSFWQQTKHFVAYFIIKLASIPPVLHLATAGMIVLFVMAVLWRRYAKHSSGPSSGPES